MKRICKFIKERWKSWRLWLSIYSLAFLVAVCFAILSKDPNLATATMAFGTLLLAFVTAWSVDAANKREKNRMAEESRMRQEERERDFKRRSLSEINNWAEETIELVDKYQRGFRDGELYDRKLILKAKVINVESVGPEFSDDFRVRVEEAIKDFEAFDEEFHKEHWDSFQEKTERCKQSLINLLESVAYLKVKLKL